MRLAGRIVLALALLFLVGPFVIIVAAGLSDSETLAFPPRGLSLRWFGAVFAMEGLRAAFALSLVLALASTAAALLLGTPAAYALDRYRPPGAGFVRALLTSPLVVPGIVAGLALLRHLVIPLGVGVEAALFLGHTALLVPYAVRVVAASLANLRPDIDEAAILLGCTRLGAFLRVVLPNLRNGILAAAILGFITSFNQVPVSLFLTGPGVSTLPIDMLAAMEFTYDPSIAAVSALLALGTVAVVFVSERLLGLSRYV